MLQRWLSHFVGEHFCPDHSEWQAQRLAKLEAAASVVVWLRHRANALRAFNQHEAWQSEAYQLDEQAAKLEAALKGKEDSDV